MLRKGAIPCILPGCPKYLSIPSSSTSSKRLKIDSKEDHFFLRAIQESQQTAKVAQERFSIDTLDVLKEKLNLISLKDWLLWSTCDNCVHFIPPHIENSKITIQASLTINSQLGTKAFCHNQPTPLSINCLTDIRQIEVLLSECYSYLNDYKHADIVQHYINSAKRHIIKAMDTGFYPGKNLCAPRLSLSLLTRA